MPMKEKLTANLHQLLEAYRSAVPLSPRTIGKRATGDDEFFQRTDPGLGFRVGTYDRAAQWFSDAWPPDVAWPGHIERPKPTRESKAA
jgi:hypothetical protein